MALILVRELCESRRRTCWEDPAAIGDAPTETPLSASLIAPPPPISAPYREVAAARCRGPEAPFDSDGVDDTADQAASRRAISSRRIYSIAARAALTVLRRSLSSGNEAARRRQYCEAPSGLFSCACDSPRYHKASGSLGSRERTRCNNVTNEGGSFTRGSSAPSAANTACAASS